MKKKSIICYILFILAGFLLTYGINKIISYKSEFVDNVRLNHNFGIVHVGKTLKTEFIIKNPFNEVLEILNVHSSCKCLLATPKNNSLAPKEEIAIPIVMNAATKPGPLNAYSVLLAQTAKTKKKYQIILSIDAVAENVIEFTEISPRINFGEVDLNMLPCERKVIISKGKHPLKWNQFTCVSQRNLLDIKIVPINQNQWELDLTLKDRDYLGVVRDNLKFVFYYNNKAVDYSLKKAFEANIVGPVMAYPQSIFYGTIKQKDKPQKNIEFFNQDKNDIVKILEISTDNYIMATITPENFIHTSFVESDLLGEIHGDISVKLLVGEQEYLYTIPYLAYIVE